MSKIKKKKSAQKPFRIKFEVPDDVYRGNLMVFIGYSTDEIRKFFKLNGMDFITLDVMEIGQDGEYSWHKDPVDGKLVNIIRMNDFRWTTYDHGVLLHEIFHYVSRLLGNRGIPLTPDTDEAYAYTIQHYYFSCLEKLKRLHPLKLDKVVPGKKK